MIDPRRLAINIDGVVANTMQLFLRCFVEDRLDTCFLMQQHDITPVVFVQPWNRRPHSSMAVDSWDQLKNIIQWS